MYYVPNIIEDAVLDLEPRISIVSPHIIGMVVETYFMLPGTSPSKLARFLQGI